MGGFGIDWYIMETLRFIATVDYVDGGKTFTCLETFI